LRRGDAARAALILERALPVYERIVGGTDVEISHPIATLGRAYQSLGAPARALPLFERALHIGDDAGADPDFRAQSRFSLAKALWDTHGDRRRARVLAKEATELYAQSVKRVGRVAREREELRAWIAQHPE
jgi:hypothetical protein